MFMVCYLFGCDIGCSMASLSASPIHKDAHQTYRTRKLGKKSQKANERIEIGNVLLARYIRMLSALTTEKN